MLSSSDSCDILQTMGGYCAVIGGAPMRVVVYLTHGHHRVIASRQVVQLARAAVFDAARGVMMMMT
jgi:hypothetical protein